MNLSITLCWSLLRDKNTLIHKPVDYSGEYCLWEAITLLSVSLLLSLAICCSLWEVHFPLSVTLSRMFSLFCHLSGPYLIWPSPLPPPSLFLLSPLPFVYQGDRGGRLTLQKRWTSFLKARLTCSLPEYDFHFNMLRSVFVMPSQTPQDTIFYGIFGLEWWVGTCVLSRSTADRDFEEANVNEWGKDERQQSIHWES